MVRSQLWSVIQICSSGAGQLKCRIEALICSCAFSFSLLMLGQVLSRVFFALHQCTLHPERKVTRDEEREGERASEIHAVEGLDFHNKKKKLRLQSYLLRPSHIRPSSSPATRTRDTGWTDRCGTESHICPIHRNARCQTIQLLHLC